MNPTQFVLLFKHSNKSIDVSGVSNDNRAKIHQWDFTGGDNQRWYMQIVSPPYFLLCSVHSGKFLSWTDSRIFQYDFLGLPMRNANPPFHGGPHHNDPPEPNWVFDPTARTAPNINQLWQFVDAGNGYFSIASSIAPNYVLDARGASQDNGTDIIVYRKNNNDNQKIGVYTLNPPIDNFSMTVEQAERLVHIAAAAASVATGNPLTGLGVEALALGAEMLGQWYGAYSVAKQAEEQRAAAEQRDRAERYYAGTRGSDNWELGCSPFNDPHRPF